MAWSTLTKEDFDADYWTAFYEWYADGGDGHVAAYLAELDLTGFDPKAPPPKTAALGYPLDSGDPYLLWCVGAPASGVQGGTLHMAVT